VATFDCPTSRSRFPEHPAWLFSLGGRRVPFSEDELHSLYPDHATYVSRVSAAADTAVMAGVLLPRHAAKLVDQAKVALVPTG
jgi:hypothetical protein